MLFYQGCGVHLVSLVLIVCWDDGNRSRSARFSHGSFVSFVGVSDVCGLGSGLMSLSFVFLDVSLSRRLYSSTKSRFLSLRSITKAWHHVCDVIETGFFFILVSI